MAGRRPESTHAVERKLDKTRRRIVHLAEAGHRVSAPSLLKRAIEEARAAVVPGTSFTMAAQKIPSVFHIHFRRKYCCGKTEIGK